MSNPPQGSSSTLSGSGAAGRIARWGGATTLGNSNFTDTAALTSLASGVDMQLDGNFYFDASQGTLGLGTLTPEANRRLHAQSPAGNTYPALFTNGTVRLYIGLVNSHARLETPSNYIDIEAWSLNPATDNNTDLGVLGGLNLRWRDLHLIRTLNGAGYAGTVATKTGAYTATVSDFLILCDATSGAFTVTLPAASTQKGLMLTIKKIDSSANAVTIDGNAAETIDGAATVSLASQYNSRTIVSSGANWHVTASV